MGKDKKKSGSKGRDREPKSKEKCNSKGNGHARATAEIAKAEKRLAKALSAVEDARELLVAREQELKELLHKHGRLPVLNVDESNPSTNDAERHDENEATASDAAVEKAPSGESPAGDAGDTKDESADGMESGGTAVAPHSVPADEHDPGSRASSVPLFDQRQVVTPPFGREAGVTNG